jgi:hypothetical protein
MCTYRTYSMLVKIFFCTIYKSSVIPSIAEQVIPILRNLCYNDSLITWTVVSLTTFKFKPLIFCMSVVAFSYTANMFILMILWEPSSQSQNHIATDGQSISKSWCRAPSGAHDPIFINLWQLRSCFCGGPSLTGGRVCFIYMLLVLASVIFLGFESLGTRDHILLSQIWDFPFHRLLPLEGSRWRYSTPPPHGYWRSL